MTVATRRLDKLAGALSPSQAMLCFLDELTACPSLEAHLRSQLGRPAGLLALTKLFQQVAQATRQAHPREPQPQGPAAGAPGGARHCVPPRPADGGE